MRSVEQVIAEHIARAPELTQAQRDRLRVLLSAGLSAEGIDGRPRGTPGASRPRDEATA